MQIHTVTILGANGTMGRNIAAIFASFGSAQVYLISRTKEKSIQAKGKAYKSVRAESVKEKMIPADYSQLEECVRQSDLIFEACAESWDIKVRIHGMIADALKQINDDKQRILCTGTSGLSITGLAELYPEKYQKMLMGMHFFNPPYQMTLCELTPTCYTDRYIFDEVYAYGKNVLFRTMVEVKDSPAFLGNRIGFQFINEALQEAELCCSFLLKYVLYSLEATKNVGYDIHSADDVMAAGFNWCPPLATIEALGGKEIFHDLCMERIGEDILGKINLEELLAEAEPSRYDYRRFIKAKY